MNSYQVRYILVGVLCVTTSLVWWPQSSECTCLRVSLFLDVGQGDSIYIETPDQYDVLVDGGPDGSVLRALGKEMGFFR